MRPIKTISHKGYTIEVYPDPDPMSPLDWGTDSHATMRVRGNRYFAPAPYLSASVPDLLFKAPLYMYPHSGVQLSLRPFDCPWDSGQVGWVYARTEEEAGWLVDDWNCYLSGTHVYFSILDSKGECVDTCSGYDDIEYAISEATSVIDIIEMDKASV